MFPRRLTAAEDADGDGRVYVFLPALGLWRLLPLIDAQQQLDNGDAVLDGPEDAPLDKNTRPPRLPPGWKAYRKERNTA